MIGSDERWFNFLFVVLDNASSRVNWFNKDTVNVVQVGDAYFVHWSNIVRSKQ